MSSAAAVYTFCVVILYCCQYPATTQETVPAKSAGAGTPVIPRAEEDRRPRIHERKEMKKYEVKANKRSWRELNSG